MSAFALTHITRGWGLAAVRYLHRIAIFGLVVFGPIAVAAVSLDRTVAFRIPSQPLDSALIEFSRQADVQLAIDAAALDRIQAPELEGILPVGAALAKLLSRSGLAYSTVGATVTIRRVESSEASSVVSNAGGPLGVIGSPRVGSETSSGTGSVSKRPSADSDYPHNRHRAGDLDEVIVTAQKRSERLLDVPSAITAVSGDRLESLQVNSVSDLAGYVPGLSVTGYGAPGSRVIVLRGISSDYNGGSSGPLVGTYMDDIPIGASTNTGRGPVFGLDLMPYDIERVEVLEGPQGTLYGSNTMGGLIKYTLRKPNLTQFEARAGTSLQHETNSGSPDWTLRGAINLPLVTGRLGLRLTAFDQTTAGWIDNVGTRQSDANHSTQKGGRAVLLWQPTDNLAIQGTVLYQQIDARDTTKVTVNPSTGQPVYGSNTSNTFFPEPFKQQTRIYSLNVKWDFGLASVTSTSGWSKLQSGIQEDLTVPFGAYVPDHPDALTLYEFSDHLSKFVQEVRLTSPENQRLQWMLGGYYTREYGGEEDNWPAFTPTYQLLPPEDNLYIWTGQNNVYKETAAFVNLTYRLTDRLDVSAGDRYSTYKQLECRGSATGLFGEGVLPCKAPTSDSVSIWMTNARFHLNERAMFYGRVATGYRPGQCWAVCPDPFVPEAPSVIHPDRTTNYELGFKGELLDRRMRLNMSVFDVEWKDMQVLALSSQGLGYASNAGTARSTGFELGSGYQVTPNLNVNLTLTYTDAHLTEDAPGVGGKNGDQLPISPRWAGSLTADYRRHMGESASVVVGGAYRYRDMIVNEFSGAAAAGALPIRPQNVVDLYTGLELQSFTLRLYGKNVFNNKSYSGLMYVSDPQNAKFVPIQPRTFGLSLDYQF
jgi:outer membrane receptor protein involved in Fe transport